MQTGGLFFGTLAQVGAAGGDFAGAGGDGFAALAYLGDNLPEFFPHVVHGCQHAVIVARTQFDIKRQIAVGNSLGNRRRVNRLAAQLAFDGAGDQPGG